MSDQKKNRLNKHLVELGLARSRRLADDLIQQGSVSVNGEVISKLATVVGPMDDVRLLGQTAKQRSHIYIILNKPVGYICSHATQGKLPTIFKLLPKNFSKLKFAGRLDADSRGALILSSDGDFIHQITHPSQHQSKYYQVKLNKSFRPSDRVNLLKGVKLTDGISRFEAVSAITPQRIKIKLHSGKNRQIRRSLESLGFGVTDLYRYQIGQNITLEGVKPGKYRFLTMREVETLCQS